MSSDLSSTSGGSSDTSPKEAAGAILKSEVAEGLDAIKRPSGSLFMSGLSGGLDVGFSVLLMGVVQTLAHGTFSDAVTRILVANMYSLGFIFVIVGRSELFTEQTTLAVLPVLRRKASIAQLLRLWVTVYVANILGAALFSGLISYVGPALKAVSVESIEAIATRMTDHSFGVMFLSAVLAGWLMGLVSWMVAAARDTISQIVLVWIVTAAIGLTGLHHSVLGTAEVLTAVFARTGVGFADFARFLAAATLGNIVGGTVFVAIIKSGHASSQGKSD